MPVNLEPQITAIIVDDEQDGREVLFHLLGLYAPDVTIVAQAEDAETACQLIDELQPQLVFLDIQMGGRNGFSVLQAYENIPFEVIFVTSYDQYALTAIKFNALDYLLKPLAIDELKAAINKATNKIGTKLGYEARIKNLLENLDSKQTPKKIAVHLKDSVHMVDLNEVMYVEADGNYCHIVTQQNQTYMITRMLKEFEDYLGELSPFVRINKSVITNLNFIAKYSKGEPCILTMENSQTFEVSRRKKQEILDKLKDK